MSSSTREQHRHYTKMVRRVTSSKALGIVSPTSKSKSRRRSRSRSRSRSSSPTHSPTPSSSSSQLGEPQLRASRNNNNNYYYEGPVEESFDREGENIANGKAGIGASDGFGQPHSFGTSVARGRSSPHELSELPTQYEATEGDPNSGVGVGGNVTLSLPPMLAKYASPDGAEFLSRFSGKATMTGNGRLPSISEPAHTESVTGDQHADDFVDGGVVSRAVATAKTNDARIMSRLSSAGDVYDAGQQPVNNRRTKSMQNLKGPPPRSRPTPRSSTANSCLLYTSPSPRDRG